MGIEPTTSGLDLLLLCRLSYEVGQRKPGTILGGESRRRESGSIVANPIIYRLVPSSSRYEIRKIVLTL